MRKLQKILLGIFLGGVLLGGIGSGIAFVEYSSITYAGERKIGAESMVTKDFDFSFDPGKGIVQIAPAWYDEGQVSYAEPDETVPEGVIRYRVTYNEKTVTPYLNFVEYNESDWTEEDGEDHDMGNLDPEDAGQDTVMEPEIVAEIQAGSQTGSQTEKKLRPQGEVYLSKNYRDDFGLWMENKDEILNDLKHGRIASYRAENITDVKVLVNPASKPFIEQER